MSCMNEFILKQYHAVHHQTVLIFYYTYYKITHIVYFKRKVYTLFKYTFKMIAMIVTLFEMSTPESEWEHCKLQWKNRKTLPLPWLSLKYCTQKYSTRYQLSKIQHSLVIIISEYTQISTHFVHEWFICYFECIHAGV